MDMFTAKCCQNAGQGEVMTVGAGNVKIPLISWYLKRKQKKRQKRKAEITKAAQDAVQSAQAMSADELVKKIALYQVSQTRIQEKLEVQSAENRNLKYNVNHLEQKVLKLEKSLISASNLSIHSNAQHNVETQTSEVFCSQSLTDFAYPPMPTPDLESMQTKVMSLEFTVFRQNKLMELMEETLKAYEPSFSLKPFNEKSL